MGHEMEIQLDARCLTERSEAHVYLQSMLRLPDYYGKNLDALYDCLSEQTDLRLVLLHGREAEQTGTFYKRLRRVLADAAEDNPGLTVEERDE